MYKWNDRIDYESIDQLKAEINYYYFFWLQPLIQHSVFPLELFCDLIICDSPDESKMAVSQANNRGRAGGREGGRWRSGGGGSNNNFILHINEESQREKFHFGKSN